MNTLKKAIVFGIASISILIISPAKAQEGTAELKVKTSAVCDMCKETIEKELAFEKGVKRSTLDVPSKIVTVVYNPNKTTPEKIRLAISKAGYDADDVKANPKAYNKLDACCKKGAVCNDKMVPAKH
ncbi:MAG: heavy metal-associated domain-containing protein [Bacteroidota bacterium]